MAEIRPFRGVRYNVDRVGDVVAPPYDVIDSQTQRALYDAHPNNVVRIIQGRVEPGDSESANQYTRAASLFRDWLRKGTLQRDPEESIYIYRQHFGASGAATPGCRVRTGLVTTVRVEPLGEGSILPHEHTMPGPKADRLQLMRHTGAAFGQIFSLYSDPQGRVRGLLERHLDGPALFSFCDGEGVRHSLRRVADPGTIEAISEALADQPLFIADGHHRYETAVAYRDERTAAEGTDPSGRPYGYSMQTLVCMDDGEGLAIFPLHRVVTGLESRHADALEEGLRELFDVESAPADGPEQVMGELRRRGAAGKAVYAFLRGECREVRYLTLKPSVDPSALDVEGRSEAWRRLDSALLQMALGRILDLDSAALTGGDKVRFVYGADNVVALVRGSADRVGFLLNPVRMEQLREVVLAGDRMPPKSTFFYPKVYSGLVIQDLEQF